MSRVGRKKEEAVQEVRATKTNNKYWDGWSEVDPVWLTP
jgi:hypothetical protein